MSVYALYYTIYYFKLHLMGLNRGWWVMSINASAYETKFLESIRSDLASNRLALPVLPEIALKVRDAVEDDNANIDSIAKIIEEDTSVSARLMQVANSALFSRGRPAQDVKSAIMSLGMNMVKSLVVGVVMKQMFQPTEARIDEILRETLQHSAEVAAFCRVFASLKLRGVKGINPDTAFLAGLMHDIGVLPILMYAHDCDFVVSDEELLSTIQELHCEVGKSVLEKWNFPPEIINAVASHEDVSCLYDDKLDYSDIVMVANIESRVHSGGIYAERWKDVDLSKNPAFQKLGIDPSFDEEIVLAPPPIFD